jgi:hypothetical protein
MLRSMCHRTTGRIRHRRTQSDRGMYSRTVRRRIIKLLRLRQIMIGQTTRGMTGPLRRNLRAPTIIGRIRHRQTCSLTGHQRMIAPIRLLRTRSRIVRPTTSGQRMSATIGLRPRGRRRPAQASSRISSERCSRRRVNSSRSSARRRWSVSNRRRVNSSRSSARHRWSVSSRRLVNSSRSSARLKWSVSNRRRVNSSRSSARLKWSVSSHRRVNSSRSGRNSRTNPGRRTRISRQKDRLSFDYRFGRGHLPQGSLRPFYF